MKTQILKILQMQEEGKLTQDQAAELLAVLADQAREKGGASGSGGGEGKADGPGGKGADTQAPPEGAPGPRGDSPRPSGSPGGTCRDSFGSTAAAAIHELVDTAIGVGTTVGRAASMWGGEFLNMVHRDEGGNSVTLSKVDGPHGEAYSFRGNTVNVSKVVHLQLQQAEFSGNCLNASKVAHVQITRGRFSQCSVSGSALTHVTIEGLAPDAPAAPTAAGGEPAKIAGIRNVTFNATKFVRITLGAGSSLENGTFQAAAIKDLELGAGSLLKDVRVNDSSVAALRMEKASAASLLVERSHVHGLAVRESALDRVTISSTRVSDLKITGGGWTNVRIRRDSGRIAGIGSGRESTLLETVFEGCTLENCEFAGCTFRRTTLRNVKLSGLTVRNVDFTGQTLESEEAFRRAAGM